MMHVGSWTTWTLSSILPRKSQKDFSVHNIFEGQEINFLPDIFLLPILFVRTSHVCRAQKFTAQSCGQYSNCHFSVEEILFALISKEINFKAWFTKIVTWTVCDIISWFFCVYFWYNFNLGMFRSFVNKYVEHLQTSWCLLYFGKKKSKKYV